MQVNRGLVFWGLALVTAGTVALLIQSGSIAEESARELWRFWPVALIVAGLAIIAAHTPFALPATAVAGLVVGGLAGTLVAGWPGGPGIGCSGQPTQLLRESGSFTGSATEVELRMNCGRLGISTAAGSDWSLDARHGAGEELRLEADDTSLRLMAEGGGPMGFGSTRQEWDVTLPTDPALDLEIHANSATSRLDLREADLTSLTLDTNAGDVSVELAGTSVDELSLEMNAGSVRIAADGESRLAGEVSMNAGSLELCAPEGTAVEILLDDPNVTFSHNLAERGFIESDERWSSGTGAPDIRLEVEGNAASFTFNPSGGCS